MKSDTTRRNPLASVPTAAAMAVPTVASAAATMMPAIAGTAEGVDAELLALGQKLAPLVAEINAAKGVEKDDQFWPDIFDEASAILDEALKYQSTTLEGFAVQTLALVTAYDDMFLEEPTLELPRLPLVTFLRNACAFAGLSAPVPL
jgi:hypothetical protein